MNSTGTDDGHTVTGGLSVVDGVDCYRIDGVDAMEPFLMTVVSDTDLWMFVSSTGALTAGRIDADHAFFPYETDDRLHRAAGTAGPVTVIARSVDGVREIWRPYGRQLTDGCRRSIAKSVLGDRLVFEEHHPRWAVTFRATWAPSDRFGWVRTVELLDAGGASTCEYDVLDGLVDVMPAGVDALTEQIRSNLVDAYKRSEVGPWGPLAVYSLESLISDRAEPVEALTATVVWSAGFPAATPELDARCVADAIAGTTRTPAQLVTGRAGAYLLRGTVSVPLGGSARWMIVADTGLDQVAVLDAVSVAAADDATGQVGGDVALGSERLRELLAAADGFQETGDDVADAHHLSNVLFNSMRGGVFPFGHLVPTDGVAVFVEGRNRDVAARQRSWFSGLDPWMAVGDLRTKALVTGDADLIRLVLEYLPLTFSRRHGDPSRPWNRFSINVRDEHGEPELAYQGNWRDIFQNWEALLQSYPAYFADIVAKFVNASTLDGYNPYRISQDGIDWEVPDPDDPWSHIGYWGDHQVVYLLRLIEMWERYEPGAIAAWLDRAVFVFADVPYAIADHDEMVLDPRNTITFREDRAADVADRVRRLGGDGRLVPGADGGLLHVGLLEKLVVTALAKLTNFVPDGGLWLNTQRPEWNDANNALAGPGLSMVTLYHLRRYVDVVRTLTETIPTATVTFSSSVAEWLDDVRSILAEIDESVIDDHRRRSVLDALGRSGEAHRHRIEAGSGLDEVAVSVDDIRHLCAVSCAQLDRSIRSAKRPDGLYHSYNRVSFPTPATACVDHLGPMLEGQVAVLSSGVLGAGEAADLVDTLFDSGMYRPDQQTFMLYPAVELGSFLQRNRISEDAARRLHAIDWHDGALESVVAVDRAGDLHFRPEVVNERALEELLSTVGIADHDRATVRDVYEEVFDHGSFTGRSGSMYGYEGIGSVYWHMVAKLLLAVQESYWSAVDAGDADAVVERLADAYRRVRSGLGFEKTPTAFGAIPTDCYSHTPAHAGAQQPGMTGQVKEEVLTRFGELGFRVVDGCLTLSPGLIPADEIFPVSPDGTVGPARLTVCAVPMTVRLGSADSVVVESADGTVERSGDLALSPTQSQDVFARAGSVIGVDWTIGAGPSNRATAATAGDNRRYHGPPLRRAAAPRAR